MKQPIAFSDINQILIALISTAIVAFSAAKGWAQTSYYSKGSLDATSHYSWNTLRDGSGSEPGSFGTNNIWIIQNGHSMSVSDPHTWNVGATNGQLLIEAGGSLLNTSNTASAISVGTFTIHGGGTYISNTGRAQIPGTTRNFANSTNGGNGNGTIIIQNYGTSGFPAGITWGNVIVNRETTTQAVGHSANFKTIEGSFTMEQHGTHEFRFTAAQTDVHIIMGSLVVNGGILNLKSGTGSLPVSIGGSLIITGGTFTQTSGESDITFTGSSSSFIHTGGTFTNTRMSFAVEENAFISFENNFTLASLKTFTIAPAGKATFLGDFTNNATAGIVLKSPNDSHGAPGSLIINGSISGSGTMTAERHILAYSSNADGWHLVSSPLSTTNIAGNTTLAPGAGDDFYAFSETTSQWLNQKVGANNIDAMGAGLGYLVSYESASTKTFTGAPNNASVTHTNMSVSPSHGQGWHLLGNPFQSAIIWNDHADWNITNIGGVAKIMNNTGSFTDVLAQDIIPAMQGFWVQATNETNAITIPLAARTHNAASWNKNTPSGHILLSAKDLDAGMEQESRIRFNPNATAGFDLAYDSRFMAWYAPQFYSLAGAEKLSTNTLPELTSDLVVPMGFKKNAASGFSITLKNAPQGQTIFLHDLVAGQIHRISDNPVYAFTATADDPELRFRILFDEPTNAEEPQTGENDPRVYAYGRTLYVQMPAMAEASLMQVFDISGRVVYSRSLPAADLHAVETSLSPGVYVVRISGRRSQASQRVVVW